MSAGPLCFFAVRMMFKMAGMIFCALLIALSACAQTVNLWPTIAPGSEAWKQKERVEANTLLGAVVFNVVTPTLTAYLPARVRRPERALSLRRGERLSHLPSIWKPTAWRGGYRGAG
jgi:acyl-CoA synthetase (AMP-forming)/AMP-acid ligase II